MIAIQASLTGHLVLATLHTNDSVSAITRLINMGIEPYLIAAALRGVITQRLVRRLCVRCRKPGSVPRSMQKVVERKSPGRRFFTASGCEACRDSGYNGRIGVFELLRVTDELTDTISRAPSLTELRRIAVAEGLYTLLEDGIRKAGEGITSLEEIARVVTT